MATAPAASPAPVLLDHYALAQAFPQVQREYAWATALAPPLVGPATFPEFRDGSSSRPAHRDGTRLAGLGCRKDKERRNG